MYKAIAVLAVAFVSGLAMAAEEPASLPKEGSGTGVAMGSVTLKVLPLGKDRTQMSWEFLGANLDDSGKGLGHNTSIRCVGARGQGRGHPGHLRHHRRDREAGRHHRHDRVDALRRPAGDGGDRADRHPREVELQAARIGGGSAWADAGPGPQ
jgi:hypothetical protein